MLAQAVQELFPEAKLGIGPPITDGFYYDFDVPEAFTPEDLEALEKRMRQIVKEGQLFSRRVYESKDQAREELANEPYKLELVDDKSGDPEVMEVGGDELTAYDNLNPRTRERDLGRPVPRAAHPDDQIHPRVQTDPQLGRVLARQPGQRQPAAHLRHRLGVAGGARQAHANSSRRRSAAITASSVWSWTCSASPTKSVPVWRFSTPRAASSATSWRTTRGAKHIEAGYQFVNTPHITKAQLFHHLGSPGLVRRRHVPADAHRRRVQRRRHGAQARPGLLPQADELPDALPDLPGAGRSYRELPLRLFEFGSVYRYEKSGVVHGLTRVRGMTHGRRAHLLHPRPDARRADRRCCGSCSTCSPTTGSTTSTWSCPPRTRTSSSAPTRCGTRPPAPWPRSPRRPGWTLVPDPGGAAFYGPKISVQVKDALGRNWQMSTIQLDFNLPERFELEYTAADGTPAAAGDDPPRAVRVDRAVLRRPHRALRGRVPGLAGAGAGGRHPGRRRSRRATWKTLPRN